MASDFCKGPLSTVCVVCFAALCITSGSLLVWNSMTQEEELEWTSVVWETTEVTAPSLNKGMPTRSKNQPVWQTKDGRTKIATQSTSVPGSGNDKEVMDMHSIAMVMSGLFLIICGTLSCSCLMK